MSSADAPIQGGEPPQKRRRKIWSCNECRRRKVHCDRSLPVCSGCSKSRRAARCVYIEDEPTVLAIGQADLSANRTDAVGHSTSTAMQPESLLTLARLAERLRRLESMVKQSGTAYIDSHSQSGVPDIDNSPGRKFAAAALNDGILFPPIRGRAFTTKFSGVTHVSMILNKIPGLNQFTREAFDKSPAMDHIRRAVHRSETWSEPAGPVTVESLYGLLPPRAETDALVEAYLQSFELVYHILCLPEFRREYANLWIEERSQKPEFLIVALLIVAIALCLNCPLTSETTPALPSTRDRATRIIQVCETWFQSRPLHYHRLLDFQAAFLLLLARQVNGRRYKQTWPNSGKLVRIFMSAGLHREATNLRREEDMITPLDHELRRRIWAAAAEFELQASFEQGMPPIPSISLRHSLTTLLNSARPPLSFPEVKEWTEKFMSYLHTLPRCSTTKTKPIHALACLTLHQYQLVLHVRNASSQSTSALERDFSLMVLWTTAREIVTLHQAVVATGSNMLELLCGDQLRAALSLCYVYVTHLETRNMHITYLSVPVHELLSLMQDTMHLIRDKALRFGGDQRQLWIATASCAFVKAIREPAKWEHFLTLAVEEFVPAFCTNDVDALGLTASGLSFDSNCPPPVDLGAQVTDDSNTGQDSFHGTGHAIAWEELDDLNAQEFADFFDWFDFN
ncbi:hypothetical protein BJX66DRAFT_330354 [Aspergillus keveii]|uniref:Zn(2)-C6 fungal-type domain-containing protein n=1 Tax=Aspergillus keveii TaxID=714993 RepID=A0ABR4FKU2_9EURO